LGGDVAVVIARLCVKSIDVSVVPTSTPSIESVMLASATLSVAARAIVKPGVTAFFGRRCHHQCRRHIVTAKRTESCTEDLHGVLLTGSAAMTS
jgi:hypothetical protein